jgi:hypothetical protein
MDIKEASAMTEASGLTNDPDMPGNAKVSDARLPAASLFAQLRKMTLEAPLQSLLLAFLLGVLVARRR